MRKCAILSFDQEWQYPVITEKAAFEGLKTLFKTIRHSSEEIASSQNVEQLDGCIVYLAYPWATLIDSIRKKSEKGLIMFRVLRHIGEKLSKAHSVVTTCQHIHAYEHASLFKEARVSDMFWSHNPNPLLAVKNSIDFARIYSFQLYPAQAINIPKCDMIGGAFRRKYLFSFAGATSSQYYISQTREAIGRLLSKSANSFVSVKETWHYQKIVYDEQINMTASGFSAQDSGYLQLLLDSDFSLCPVGTGPNTIRFWESINTLSIPVLIGDYYQLPTCYTANWDSAIIRIPDNEDSIARIPLILQEYTDQDIYLMRQALTNIAREFSLPLFSEQIAQLLFTKALES